LEKEVTSQRLSNIELARASGTAPEVLVLLAHHEMWEVRGAVAENVSVPAGLLEELAHDAHWFVRKAVAGNPSASAGVLELLANDGDWDVRRVAAGHLLRHASLKEKGLSE
jgi:HEAT repeat protein